MSLHPPLTDEERPLWEQIVAEVLAQQPLSGDDRGLAKQAEDRADAAIEEMRRRTGT